MYEHINFIGDFENLVRDLCRRIDRVGASLLVASDGVVFLQKRKRCLDPIEDNVDVSVCCLLSKKLTE